ncbi:MAG: lipoprotein insertase outer membrane protein LolB [Burkholderiales bacterium]
MACLFLAACASPMPPLASSAPKDALMMLSGKISVRIDALNDRPPHSIVALFDLQSTDGQSGQLELSSPLGTLLGRASWSPGQVRLTTPNRESIYPDLPALSQDLLGEKVPIEALSDWLNGRPWPMAYSSPLPPPGRGFSQLDWLIRLDRETEGIILAERASAPAITVIARLIR